MCIYCGTKNYRKIYEQHYGTIPVDEDGRTYEIHHIDGNRQNNEISNLSCLSIQEHYDIHHSQKDWHACGKIAAKMKLSPELLSELARQQGKNAYSAGKHPFVKINELRSDPKIYDWKNRLTGERCSMTIGQLAKKCNQKAGPFTRVVNHDIQSFKGWMLSEREYDVSTTNARYNPTEYAWVNIVTGEELYATVSTIAKMNSSPSNHFAAVARRVRRTCKDWQLQNK
jgi:hypothetical protein